MSAVSDGFACPSWSTADPRRIARFVHQGGNRLPEVVAGNALETKWGAAGEGPPGMRLAKWLRFSKRHHGLAETRRDRSETGGRVILEMINPLVKLPRLDSNQQPFGLSKVLCC